MLAMYKKRKRINHDICKFISNILFVSGVLFILALRGLSSPETSRQGNFFGILGMIIAITVTFLSTGQFFNWIYLCFSFHFY